MQLDATADLTVSYLLSFDVIVSSKELLPYVMRIQTAVLAATQFPELATACKKADLFEEPKKEKPKFFGFKPIKTLPAIILALPKLKAVKIASADSKFAKRSHELFRKMSIRQDAFGSTRARDSTWSLENRDGSPTS